jgi:hypothetical protein
VRLRASIAARRRERSLLDHSSRFAVAAAAMNPPVLERPLDRRAPVLGTGVIEHRSGNTAPASPWCRTT